MNDKQPNILSTLSPEEQRRVDRLCDEFEQAFRQGATPRIEDVLSQLPGNLVPSALAYLIGLEIELLGVTDAQEAGAEYRGRFTDQADAVEVALRRAFPEARDDDSVPERIGRFEIRELLGSGKFGRVYLAHDGDMDRLVALKVPTRKLFEKGRSVETFLQEARSAAQVKHPGLVTIHDVQTEGDQPYIVQEYIRGGNLADWIERENPSLETVARLLIEVAEALVVVHGRDLVHRDLKPANILVDEIGHAYVADFGLALHVSLQHQRQGEVAGSPAYMSPEQVRGEAHRLDGRSDIWSLGVIMYEMLTGQRPFAGEVLLDQILHRDPRPPRMLSPSVPVELARICLACLAKRATDRYQSATDLIDDLRHWLEGKPTAPTASESNQDSSTEASVQIVPKGLRSFDAGDADFFLELLPGPRDREGLPKGIRFWKTQIEQRDPDETFSVGLMYGPSGCGKSSLVKAGLIPRLSGDILPVYVEATAADTEVRLIKALRKHCPDLPEGDSLPELIARLRDGGGWRGRKVLLVLDQFEQWLHAHGGEDSSQLINALRQCDGRRLQCIVMVRDDFWMAATRFMRELEVRLLEAVNSAPVDLFDQDHARRVLAAFGRAYGRLSEELTADEETFLEQSVKGLAQEGKVMCVRLSLFADMMKGRLWTPAALQHVGGTEGIGVTFLEETFSASTAPPEHRLHQKAARAVLKALLPAAGTDIKGHMRSYESLLDASGYTARPQEFVELIRILDSEIRLITPTDPDGIDSESEARPEIDSGQKYYQLTHDYLVASLRDWLTRKQRETRRGRAELRLAELAAFWNAKPENRHLPSPWEYLRIRSMTSSAKWSDPERKMMRRTDWVRGTRFIAALCLLLAVTGASLFGWNQYRHLRAEDFVAAVLTATARALPDAIENVRPVAYHARPILRERLNDTTLDPVFRLHAACALAELGEFDFEFPFATLRNCSSVERPNVISALQRASGRWKSSLVEQIETADMQQDWRLKARLAILALHEGNLHPAEDMLEFRERPNPIERTIFIDTFATWHGDLRDLAHKMVDAEHWGLRSGICLAIGKVEEIDAEAKADWQELLTEWRQNQPDSGTHSATMRTLRQWNMVPEITVSSNQAQDFDWVITKETELTMIRIPAGTLEASGDEGQGQTLDVSEFWLSDREVSIALFERFMVEADPAKCPGDWEGAYAFDDKIDDDHPVQKVSWYDAVMFCNWLSEKEGRTPYYDLSADAVSRHQYTVETNEEADGFRLPTERQWEYACRAGTVTRFCFSDEEALLADYCVYSVNSNSQTAQRGSRLCNAWGLFDMHGNVWEWCWDELGSRLVGRGGSWFSTARGCESFTPLERRDPTGRHYDLGFRVATVPSGRKQAGSGAESGSR